MHVMFQATQWKRLRKRYRKTKLNPSCRRTDDERYDDERIEIDAKHQETSMRVSWTSFLTLRVERESMVSRGTNSGLSTSHGGELFRVEKS